MVASEDPVIVALTKAIGEPTRVNEDTGKIDYGDWTPNALRSVVVMSGFVLLEWFAGSKKAKKLGSTVSVTLIADKPFNREGAKDPVYAVLNKRGYRNIEEIIVDQKYGCDIQKIADCQLRNRVDYEEDSSGYVDAAKQSSNSEDKTKTSGWNTKRGSRGNTRLRSVTEMQFIQGINPVAFRDSFVQVRQQQEASGDFSEISGLLQKSGYGNIINVVNELEESDQSFINRFTLTPNIYPADDFNGSMAQNLINLDNGSYVNPEAEVSEEEEETAFDETQLYTLLKTAARAKINAEALVKSSNTQEESGPDDDSKESDKSYEYQAIADLLTTITLHQKGEKPSEDIKIPSKSAEFEDGHGVFRLDSTSKIQSVYQNVKDVFGSCPTVLDTSQEEVFKYYSKIMGRLQKDYPEVFESQSESNEDKKEEEAEKPEETKDVLAEKIRSRYGMMINGKVSNVLKEYEAIFSPGYDLDRPYSILGNGETQYSTDKGGTVSVQKWNDISSIIMDVWNSVNQELGISSVYGQMAKEEFSKPTPGAYYPQLMTRFAYGYYPRDHGGKTEYTTWSEYSKNIAKPFLEKVMEETAKGILQPVENDDKAILNMRGEVEQALDVVASNLLRCLMVSSLKMTKGEGYDKKFVSMKVKMLTPANVDKDTIKNEIFEAIAGAVDRSILIQGKSIVDQNGRYIEVGFIADEVRDNAEPLFAYQALKTLRDRGIPFTPNINTALLGKDSKGRLLRIGDKASNGKKIDLNSFFSHYILAASRAGKGVMTLSILAGGMDGKTPLAYGDNKPDMLSLLRKINPNVFGINGESCISNPADGNDPFSQFGSVDSEVNWENVPDYLVDGGYITSKTYTSVGNIYYVRFMQLVLGIVFARVTAAQYLNELGGEDGWTIVFDEFANIVKSFQVLTSNWSLKLAPTRSIKNVLKEAEKEGSSLEEALKDNSIQPGMFWASKFLNSMKESVIFMSGKNDAGFNTERKRNNLFILGQHKLEMVDASKITTTFRPRVATAKPENMTDSTCRYLISCLTRVGDADAFLGASESSDDFLNASNPDASLANSYLNRTTRGFAYVSGITGGKAEKLYAAWGNRGTKEERVAFSNAQTYFKPFLLMESSDMDSYPVREMLNSVQRATGSVDDFIAQNSAPNNPSILNSGISFEGYLEQAGVSKQALYNQLQKGADIANWVVRNALGYPGSWRDFIYDLRPEWIFSVKDVADSLEKSQKAGRLGAGAEYFVSDERKSKDEVLNDMAQLYPELMPIDVTSSNEYSGSTEELGGDFGAESPDFAETQEMPAVDTDEEVAPQEVDPFSTPFTADAEEPAEVDPEVLDQRQEDYGFESPAETTPVDEMQLVTTYILRQLGGPATGGRRVLEADMRKLSVGGVPVMMSNIASPQLKVNWAELLKGNYITELTTTSNYVNHSIAPAMGWGTCSYDTFFRDCRSLGILTVDGKQYSRQGQAENAATGQGAWQDPRNTLNNESLFDWFGNSGASDSERQAGEDLITAGLNRGKESFKNGGLVRKGACAALGLTGASLITGGASTALLCSLAVWPPAWGVVAIAAAVGMYKKGKRNRANTGYSSRR